jgi:hypothetical protein
MKLSSLFAAAAVSSLLLAGPVLAQNTAAPAAKSDTAAPAAAPAASTKTTKARSPESVECSKQADEKGLKGKERKKFRRDCIKSAKAGAGGAPAATK